MLKKIFFTLGIAILTYGSAAAQNATVKGKVFESNGKTVVDGAAVCLLQGGSVIMGVVTDRRGEFSLTPVPTGTYDLRVTYSGMGPYLKKGIEVKPNTTTIFDDIKMGSSIMDTLIVDADRPMFVKGRPDRVQERTGKDLTEMPIKTVNNMIAGMAGVTVGAGGSVSIRANRDNPQYYVDDVPTSAVPMGAIENFALISGSIPAEYGDASSVISIETKGPSTELHGDVYLTTYVDWFNSVQVQASLTGPILSKKPKNDNGRGLFVGYMVALDASYVKGSVPWKGYYRASQETIDFLKANPFRATEDASSSVINRNVDFVTKAGNTSFGEQGNALTLEEKRGRITQNDWSTSVLIRPKIDIRTPANIDLSVGGRFSYSKERNFSFANSLFNSDNNSMYESMGWEVNVRFTHKLGLNANRGTDEGDNKGKQQIIRNAYYRLNAYYIHSNSKTYNHIHQDNLFNYGYVGTFDHVKIPYYERGTVIDPVDSSIWENVWKQTAFQNIAVNFNPSDLNPAMAQYTLSAEERYGNTLPMDEYILLYTGLLNGRTPEAIYSMFSAPGVPSNSFRKSLTDRVGGKAIVSFEIRNHAIRFGFDYDQQIGKSYDINPIGLWTLMRQKTNSHILELDFDNPIFLLDDEGERTGWVNHNRLVDLANESSFDRNLRKRLQERGYKIDPDTWIDIDSYDPSLYSLDLFSAEELFNSGSGFNGDRSPSISYSGYDYTGKRTTNRSITMADVRNWFDEGNPNNKRDLSVMGAVKPVKMAAYIQDNFSIQTLYVQLGLRLDIFNTNQPYVYDMFLYRDAYTVNEAQTTKDARLKLSDAFIPEGMNGSDDFYIYVRDPDASVVDIVAFRNGKTWYDKTGNIVTDPETIAKEEGMVQLLPFLKENLKDLDGHITKVNHKAFRDYTPTFENGGITLSPRIAFSFEVGDNSQFSASYNVLTTWTNARQSFDPISYLYFEKFANQNTPFANPALKPERSVNYEISFNQLINKNMSMEIGAYYSERKDQVVLYQYSQAYPRTYFSYTNMDFGTVQGFIFGLNMRPGKEGRAKLHANYTLQFAKGTGSDPNSTLSLLRSGQPNLRTLTALQNDQRHKINLQLIFAFQPTDGMIKRVNKKGQFKEHKWLKNVIASLDLGAGSGLPYTRSSTPYAQAASNISQGDRVVEGAINGSRMPWTIDGNLMIRKGFDIVLKKEENGKNKLGRMEVSFVIQNIIGYKNERQVYSYTGSRVDDGFLTAKDFQQYISDQANPASFIDYYTINMEGLNPYGGPRRFQLQLSFSF